MNTLTYVGPGGGDYAQETTYRYVGAGQGEMGVLRIPSRGSNWCLICIVPGILALLGLPLLLWALSASATPSPTSTTTLAAPPVAGAAPMMDAPPMAPPILGAPPMMDAPPEPTPKPTHSPTPAPPETTQPPPPPPP